MAAPDGKLIGKKTLANLATDAGEPKLEKLASAVRSGRATHLEMKDPFGGEEVVAFTAPIKTGKWAVVLAAPKSEVMAGANALRTKFLLIALGVLVAAGTAILLVARRIASRCRT